MNPLSSIHAEVTRWAAWVLDTLGWALAIWAAFFVLLVWAAWMLTKDDNRGDSGD